MRKLSARTSADQRRCYFLETTVHAYANREKLQITVAGIDGAEI
jgi:hypothetical protein